MRAPATRSAGINEGLSAPHVVSARPGRRELQKVVEYRPAMRLDPIGAVHGVLLNLKQALFEIAYWVGFGRTGYLEARNVRIQTLAVVALVAMVAVVCTSKAPNYAAASVRRPSLMQAQAPQTGTKVSEANETVTEVTVEGVPPSSEKS